MVGLFTRALLESAGLRCGGVLLCSCPPSGHLPDVFSNPLFDTPDVTIKLNPIKSSWMTVIPGLTKQVGQIVWQVYHFRITLPVGRKSMTISLASDAPDVDIALSIVHLWTRVFFYCSLIHSILSSVFPIHGNVLSHQNPIHTS